jgi:hypothetical protein
MQAGLDVVAAVVATVAEKVAVVEHLRWSISG